MVVHLWAGKELPFPRVCSELISMLASGKVVFLRWSNEFGILGCFGGLVTRCELVFPSSARLAKKGKGCCCSSVVVVVVVEVANN